MLLEKRSSRPMVNQAFIVHICTEDFISHCAANFQFINPFMPSGLFCLKTLDRSVSDIRGVWLVLIVTMFLEISELIANSVDPDQTPHSAASDLGLNCLPMSLLWDASGLILTILIHRSFNLFRCLRCLLRVICDKNVRA